MTKLLKHVKKITLVTTTTFLFILTATSGTTPVLPLPGITIETGDTIDLKQPDIQPMSDEDDEQTEQKKL